MHYHTPLACEKGSPSVVQHLWTSLRNYCELAEETNKVATSTTHQTDGSFATIAPAMTR